jgi:hypothetical protein
MRCRLGTRKVRQLRAQTGLPIVQAYTRGNWDHAVLCYCRDGRVLLVWPDGRQELDARATPWDAAAHAAAHPDQHRF